MKILKPGNVEQRKFTCKCCGCVFVVDISERNYSLGYYVRCPQCKHPDTIWWSEGEPYEEPAQDDRERLAQLLAEAMFSSNNLGKQADYLIANGVTFREG